MAAPTITLTGPLEVAGSAPITGPAIANAVNPALAALYSQFNTALTGVLVQGTGILGINNPSITIGPLADTTLGPSGVAFPTFSLTATGLKLPGVAALSAAGTLVLTSTTSLTPAQLALSGLTLTPGLLTFSDGSKVGASGLQLSNGTTLNSTGLSLPDTTALTQGQLFLNGPALSDATLTTNSLSLAGGNLTITVDPATGLTIVSFGNLPNTDPHHLGALWLNSTTLSVSQG